MGTQLEQLHVIETRWRKKRFIELLGWRNVLAITAILFIFQLLGLLLFGDIFIAIVYSVLGIFLLVEITLLIIWVDEGLG